MVYVRENARAAIVAPFESFVNSEDIIVSNIVPELDKASTLGTWRRMRK